MRANCPKLKPQASFSAEAGSDDETAQPPPMDPMKDPKKTVIVNFGHLDEDGVAVHALGCPWICGPGSDAQDHGWSRYAWEDLRDRGDLIIPGGEHGESCCRHLLKRYGIAESMITFFATGSMDFGDGD